ncbi:uncharacterized protein LOC134177215 [Corticium candelabrum]|uniref:uncharacterized protein LOC134177215 n=1 Tax=Corticium candelabrum TaxID=121492 RepID=UPI002E263C45|nr:uncharacterized protein LOC134177215 [Corticium candelabrum]
MITILLTLLWVVGLVRSKQGTDVFCGDKYHLSNENVTIYQQENKSLVLSTNSPSSKNITWILDPKHRSRAQSIRQHLRIDNQSNLIIDFNARLNDVVVSYSINKSYSSATARLLVGEPPVIDVYNDSSVTSNLSTSDVSVGKRVICLSVRAIPFPTLSVSCNGVRVRSFDKQQNGVTCFDLSCDKRLSVVAKNCFGNKRLKSDIQTQPDIGVPTPTPLSTNTEHSTGTPSVSAAYTSPQFITHSADHSAQLPTTTIAVAISVSLLLLLIIAIAMVILVPRWAKKQYNVKSNQQAVWIRKNVE